MLSLFKKQVATQASVPFQYPVVDLHSHLIPGIDDGSPSMDITISFLKELQKLGYKNIITTPHIMIDHYPNTKDGILRGCDKVRNAVVKEGLQIEVDAAAEYFLDEHFLSLIEKDELLCFGRENYVLFEMSFMQESMMIEHVIFELKARGYTPLLAHPERYNYYLTDYSRLHKFKELGCSLQLNINSVTGYYGNRHKTMALNLLKDGLIDFVGSDLHHDRHLNALKSLKNSGYYPLLEAAIQRNNGLI
ncbi:tyrosine-protein phosphatase [Solitalea lacus]|uniref:tyrosine-protein phosphatase n=1 Tax=Solitalea lacus TaxID=2911172 RepID=UPI001EDAE2E1|nr:CpsB/CapC family capsule biosynthesis tyrosine phosphatase [Solitalea lacus]UKJ07088.1 histidinol phosphatase [Solitalea lacus]